MPVEFNLHSGKYCDAGVNKCTGTLRRNQIALPQGVSGTTVREEVDSTVALRSILGVGCML